MVGPFRRFMPLVVGGGLLGFMGTLVTAQTPAPAKPDEKHLAPAAYALPGEDPPKGFVPTHPRTVAESKRVESLRYYAVARAQEDLRQYPEAVRTLEKALALDPEASAVLRRLSRLSFALGRDGDAIGYCKRVIATDPGDVETIALLIDRYKDDPPAAEAFLKQTLANPKLDKTATGALYLEFELGNLYEATQRTNQAAASFAKIMDALDEKSNARLNPSELRRFLGNDEGQAYLRFGRVFLQATKFDLAIRAFRRGLVYDDDDPLLLHYLSMAYQEAGRNEDALATVERFLQRQPRGRETYDLLVKILVNLKREDEILPQLKKYAERDPRNVPLQYVLAERYRAAGQVDKANEIFNKMLEDQKETQGFGEKFPKLVKEHKTEELVVMLVRVTSKMRRLDLIRTQIEELANDGPYVDEVLDTGLKMISAVPPVVDPQEGWFVLVNLASQAKKPEKLVALLRWSLNRVPNPLVYRELYGFLTDLGRYKEAEQTLRELFDKFRDERTTQNLLALAEAQAKQEKFDEAIATVQDALAQDLNNPAATRDLAVLLNQVGRTDEALATLRNAINAGPNNPRLALILGNMLAQVGKNTEAIDVLKGLLEKYRDDDDLIRTTRSVLSVVYTNLGDYAKGEAELETLLAQNPQDATINNDLGYLYADQGKNLEKAETMIRHAIEEEPSNSAFLDSLGWVLFKRGKAQEAKMPLEKAASDPKNEDATMHDHLGDVYFQLQELAKARTAWERAAKLANQSRPPDKRLPEIRKKLQALQQMDPTPRPAKPTTP